MTQSVNGAYITDDAVTPCISKLQDYKEAIKKFKESHDSRVTQLSDEHKDQNFSQYEKWFNEYWPQIDKFKETIVKFTEFLIEKKDFINKEYAKVTVKKTNISDPMDKLNRIRSR